MIDIFISYASEDRARAALIAAALKTRGWTVFWDRTIPAGKTWRDYIGAALEEARCVLVMWSGASIASTWVQEEADSGRERGVLVPVLIEAVKQPLGFRLIQAQDLTNWDGDAAAPAFAKLAADLANMLGEPSALAAKEERRGSGEEEEAKKSAVGKAEEVKSGTEKTKQPTASPRRPLAGKGLWLGMTGALAVVVLFVFFKGFFSAPETLISENTGPAEKTVSQSRSPSVSVSTESSETDVAEQQSPAAPKTFTEPVTAMEFVWVEGGCFDMGQRKAEKEQLIQEEGEESYKKYAAGEVPLHRVCVDGLWMGQYEVTVGQFRRFVNETGYETDAEGNAGGADGCYAFKDDKWGWQSGYSWRQVGFPQQEDYPVACVSWNDVQQFIAWLNRKSGHTFRLPNEAEWEYAARGGSRTVRFWGDAVDSNACRYANVANPGYWAKSFPCEDSYQFAAPVGKFRKNNFWLYDMLGNVWEWCQDWYGEDYYSARLEDNPQGPASGTYRVNRGGSWSNDARYVRAANRDRNIPVNRINDLGFRLVLLPGQ